MALTYRTPMEDIVNCFEPATQAVIANSAATLYKEYEAKNCQYFNYYLPAIAKKKLSTAGVYLSPYSGVAHSHPACKTLENYILYSVLPSYLDSSFYFIGIKEKKLQLLKARNKKEGMGDVSVLNRYVTSADKLRYSQDFVIYSSQPSEHLVRHGRGLEANALRGIVGPLTRRKAKKLFFHDELHYWSSKNLMDFLEALKPDVMLCTVVYPPELLFKQSRSLNEWCYTYEILGDTFMFYPDGVRSEGYQQPLKGGFLLSARSLVLADGTTYMVDVLCSKFAHHLVSITRGCAVAPTHRSFGPFDATASESMTALSPEYPICYPVACEVVNKIYRYLRTLKKPDEQSAIAKLSQIVAEPTGVEIDFVECFSKLVINNGSISSTIQPESLVLFAGTWLRKLPSIFARRFRAARAVSLNDFVRGMRPYNFTIETKELNWWNVWENDFRWLFDVETEKDVVQLLDQGFHGPAGGAQLSRMSSPYKSLASLKDEAWKPLLQFDARQLYLCIRRMIYHELCGEHTRTISRSEVRNFVLSKLHRCKLVAKVARCGSSRTTMGCAEILGIGNISVLIRELISFSSRKIRWTMHEIGLEWYATTRRSNVKYIDSVPHGKGVVQELAMQWLGVLAELNLRGGQLNCEGAHKQHPGGASLPSGVECAQHKIEQMLNAEPANERLATCSCGCTILLEHLIITEHPFTPSVDVASGRYGWRCKTGSDSHVQGLVLKDMGWSKVVDDWCYVNGLNESLDSCIYHKRESTHLEPGWHDVKAEFDLRGPVVVVALTGMATCTLNCERGTLRVDVVAGQKLVLQEGALLTHGFSVLFEGEAWEMLIFRSMVREVRTEIKEKEGSDVAAGAGKVDGDEDLHGSVEEASSSDQASERSDEGIPWGGLRYVERPQPSNASLLRGKVPADGSCFWHSIGELLKLNAQEVKDVCCRHEFEDVALQKELQVCAEPDEYTTNAGIIATAIRFKAKICIWNAHTGMIHTYIPGKVRCLLNVHLEHEHYEPMYLRNGCVVRAAAESIDRSVEEVCAVVENVCGRELVEALWAGEGVDILQTEQVMQCVGVVAHIHTPEKDFVLNNEGSVHRQFELSEGHLSYNPRKKDPSLTMLKACTSHKKFPEHVVQELISCGTSVTYRPDAKRAGMLADSLYGASTGVLCSQLFNGKGNLREKFVEPKDWDLCIILGTFGSGKSTLFKKLLEHGAGRIFDYVSPRKALASNFMEDAGMMRKKKPKQGQENWKVSTFEKFLERAAFLSEGQVLIFDEMQLYPPGYFDLVLSLIDVKVRCFIVGDPAQSDYDSEKDRMLLSAMESNVEQLLRGRTYTYKILSHRFLNKNFLGRLPCTIIEEECTIDEPHVIRMHLENLLDIEPKYQKHVLVSSFDEKMVVSSYLPDAEVLTFGESTGLTFQFGTILITNVSERANDKRWVTALSRFRLNVCFVNCSGMSYQTLAEKFRGRALSKFLCQTANPEDLREVLPGSPVYKLHHVEKIGKDEGVREDKMAGDPWLKTMINLYQAPDIEVMEEPEVVMQEQWFKTHLPREELECVRAQWVHKILAKESREVRMGDMISDQFTDEHSKQKGGRQLTNAAERFETIYPRHRASDTVTFIMAVKKRLSFSKPGRERAKLFNAAVYGKSLLQEFLKHVPLKPTHNERFMSEALWNFEEKKLSKSAATIENHSGRSCRDWPIDMAQIFSKSQLCTKFDNRFRVAKAAQSIVCFQHAVLCRFAPYMRYIEMKVHEVLPKNYYIHSGKGLEELNAWVKNGKFNGVCTESDYEAFDASQDEFIMAFEIELMKYLRLPNDLIEDYKFIKTSLGSKLGNFAIMRFSGEASTFLFNTLANMLFTFMRYNVRGDEFICFAGDDMCASRRLQPTQKFAHFLDKLKLKAKVQFTEKPTFCGWHLCPDGIYKKPQLVLERMCIAKELNNLANCIDNYAIEVAFAYKLGERAVNRMSEEEVGAFYNCVRIIVRNKHLLKSDVRSTFECAE
nr:RNA-dependent RNA polymerase [Cole latent virus]